MSSIYLNPSLLKIHGAVIDSYINTEKGWESPLDTSGEKVTYTAPLYSASDMPYIYFTKLSCLIIGFNKLYSEKKDLTPEHFILKHYQELYFFIDHIFPKLSISTLLYKIYPQIQDWQQETVIKSLIKMEMKSPTLEDILIHLKKFYKEDTDIMSFLENVLNNIFKINNTFNLKPNTHTMFLKKILLDEKKLINLEEFYRWAVEVDRVEEGDFSVDENPDGAEAALEKTFKNLNDEKLTNFFTEENNCINKLLCDYLKDALIKDVDKEEMEMEEEEDYKKQKKVAIRLYEKFKTCHIQVFEESTEFDMFYNFFKNYWGRIGSGGEEGGVEGVKLTIASKGDSEADSLAADSQQVDYGYITEAINVNLSKCIIHHWYEYYKDYIEKWSGVLTLKYSFGMFLVMEPIKPIELRWKPFEELKDLTLDNFDPTKLEYYVAISPTTDGSSITPIEIDKNYWPLTPTKNSLLGILSERNKYNNLIKKLEKEELENEAPAAPAEAEAERNLESIIETIKGIVIFLEELRIILAYGIGGGEVSSWDITINDIDIINILNSFIEKIEYSDDIQEIDDLLEDCIIALKFKAREILTNVKLRIKCSLNFPNWVSSRKENTYKQYSGDISNEFKKYLTTKLLEQLFLHLDVDNRAGAAGDAGAAGAAGAAGEKYIIEQTIEHIGYYENLKDLISKDLIDEEIPKHISDPIREPISYSSADLNEILEEVGLNKNILRMARNETYILKQISEVKYYYMNVVNLFNFKEDTIEQFQDHFIMFKTWIAESQFENEFSSGLTRVISYPETIDVHKTIQGITEFLNSPEAYIKFSQVPLSAGVKLYKWYDLGTKLKLEAHIKNFFQLYIEIALPDEQRGLFGESTKQPDKKDFTPQGAATEPLSLTTVKKPVPGMKKGEITSSINNWNSETTFNLFFIILINLIYIILMSNTICDNHPEYATDFIKLSNIFNEQTIKGLVKNLIDNIDFIYMILNNQNINNVINPLEEETKIVEITKMYNMIKNELEIYEEIMQEQKKNRYIISLADKIKIFYEKLKKAKTEDILVQKLADALVEKKEEDIVKIKQKLAVALVEGKKEDREIQQELEALVKTPEQISGGGDQKHNQEQTQDKGTDIRLNLTHMNAEEGLTGDSLKNNTVEESHYSSIDLSVSSGSNSDLEGYDSYDSD